VPLSYQRGSLQIMGTRHGNGMLLISRHSIRQVSIPIPWSSSSCTIGAETIINRVLGRNQSTWVPDGSYFLSYH